MCHVLGRNGLYLVDDICPNNGRLLLISNSFCSHRCGSDDIKKQEIVSVLRPVIAQHCLLHLPTELLIKHRADGESRTVHINDACDL